MLHLYKLCSIDTALFSGLAYAHGRVKTTIRVLGSECYMYMHSCDHHGVVVQRHCFWKSTTFLPFGHYWHLASTGAIILIIICYKLLPTVLVTFLLV